MEVNCVVMPMLHPAFCHCYFGSKNVGEPLQRGICINPQFNHTTWAHVCNYCTTFYLNSPLLIQNIIRKIISYGWHFPLPIFYCEGFGQCVCVCTLLFSHKHCSRVQNRLQGLRRRFKGKKCHTNILV